MPMPRPCSAPTARLAELSHAELLARLAAAEQRAEMHAGQLQELARQLAVADAWARESEAHAADLGLLLGELGLALGLAPGVAGPSPGSPAARRLAYAERLLQRVRAATPIPLTPRQATPGSPENFMSSLADTWFVRACWLHLQPTIDRYLMSNAEGRWDGAEKAQRHIELCSFYVAIVLDCEPERARRRECAYQAVHTATQALTSHLAEAIGFPPQGAPDYDALAPLFFARFHDLAMGALVPFLSAANQAPAEC